MSGSISFSTDETLNFKLNQEVDNITINLSYQNIKETRNVRLEKRQIEDIVRVSSLQFAQEGQLGTWVNYDLGLERLAEDEKTFVGLV